MFILDRRELLRGSASLAVAATGVLTTSKLWAAQRAAGKRQGEDLPMPEVQALFFDAFGTLFDWYTGAARETEALLKPLGHNLDWPAFATAWRAQYQPFMEEVRSGQKPYVKLDIIHRRMLDKIRPEFGLDRLDEETVTKLNFIWHKLDAWEDVKPGFERLQKRFLLCACSNGNISIMTDLARRNRIHWDAILGADVGRDFKYKPHVYLDSVEALNLKPENCMMVACHSVDLNGAHGVGLRAAFILRPKEFGPGGVFEAEAHPPVDVSVKSLVELANKLGAS
jgi:2-haloacid dehalogenase